DQTPPGLEVQVPIIEEVLAALGLARVGAVNYEADDVIGTLASRAGCPVDIVTGDRDLFQLVRDDQPVRLIYTAKGVGQARAPAVVRVVCDIDLPAIDDRLPAKPKDAAQLLELSDRWSLEGALNRVLNALEQTTDGVTR